jgi:predicted nuclease of predicted toxin-antitoxin system
MKILIDMNLSPRWSSFLVSAGFEAVHWSRVGAATAPDTEIMAFARTNGFIVLTQDLDFGEILASTQGEKPSVLQIRAEDLNLHAIGGAVIAAFHQLQSELEQGALVTVNPKRTRLRVLPLPDRR